MDKKIEYLPLGSIVTIKGGIRKYVIVARGLQVDLNKDKKFFDYGGCYYPEGIIGDQLIYFQHADISNVIARGYSDDDDRMMVQNIHNAIEELDIERADVKKLKRALEH